MPSTVSSSRLGLAGLCILLAGQLLPMIDFSIVNVALDALAHSLGASETELELIVAVYGVAFAVCLAMGGRLGDNYGRRRLFDLGVALFAVASLLCGLAGSVWLLLVARALQGVGAALIVPQILATLHVSLSGHAHSRALAAYGAIGGLAFVVGQVLGGFLVSADIGGLGWRSVFLINLPICLGILLCSRRWVPETRAEHAARVDAPGTLLLAALILCLLLPLALGPSLHWSWPCALLLAAAVPLLAWLWRTELRQERRQAWPLLPPSLLRLPSIRFGLLLAILFFACWSGFMFALALALQAGAGLSPVQAGNAFIALGASYFVSALLTARVAARIGPVRLLLLGCVIQMCGLLGLMLTLQRVWPQPGILNLAPATLVIGFGQAFIVSSFFRIGLSEVPTAQAGAGSAMLATVQQASLGLGSALLGAVFAHRLERHGDYLEATQTTLAVEFVLMTLLLGATCLFYLRRAPQLPGVVFFVKDERARYVLVNRTLARRCGVKDKAELLGRSADEVFPSSLGPLYAEQDRRVLRGGATLENQLELHLYPGRQPGWCLTHKQALRDADGAIIGMAGISHDLPAAQSAHPAYGRLAAVDAHIREHYDQPLSLADLTAIAGLSVAQLERHCKRIFQLTPRQMIHKARLGAASQLLAGDAPITEIALRCGYTDHSAFSRQFKALTGLSPSQYRETHRQPRKA